MPRLESRRPFLLLVWSLVVALPLAYIASLVVSHSRDIVFWDEFDTALDLVLRIDAGAGWPELLQRFVAINNEHRMVTSRLMYAASYWLTGTINFHVIGAIGNLCLLGACAALVSAVDGWERRVRLAVILAFLMFQLEHFESFIWSGASIDHFQVVMLAMLAIVVLARRVPPASDGDTGTQPGPVLAAAACGLLATFTLAHGIVVWPAGALLLAHRRRWRALALWGGAGAAVIAAFLHGFELNPGHNVVALDPANLLRLARYWLSLLGAPLTLGHAAYAPLPGALLLAALGVLAWRGMAARQPAVFFAALFPIGALTLIALGRAELAGSEVNSRYLVHGALAWALVIFLLLELVVETQPARPLRPLVWILPALACFTVLANRKFAPSIESFTEVRDRAATSFAQFGADGKGITRLHPRDRHADILLKMAADRGVYRLPEFSRPVTLPPPIASTRMVSYVDELFASDQSVTVGGWAMLRGVESRRGRIHVLLRSEKSQRTFTTVTLQRSDLAAYYKEPAWRLGGFRAVIRRERLPAEKFQVGLIVVAGGKAELTMTDNVIDLSAPQPTVVRSTAAP